MLVASVMKSWTIFGGLRGKSSQVSSALVIPFRGLSGLKMPSKFSIRFVFFVILIIFIVILIIIVVPTDIDIILNEAIGNPTINLAPADWRYWRDGIRGRSKHSTSGSESSLCGG